MKTIERVNTPHGQRVIFTGETGPKILPPKFADGHELIRNMLNLCDMFFRDPVGTVGREWMINGKRTNEKPKKMFIEEDDSECVEVQTQGAT